MRRLSQIHRNQRAHQHGRYLHLGRRFRECLLLPLMDGSLQPVITFRMYSAVVVHIVPLAIFFLRTWKKLLRATLLFTAIERMREYALVVANIIDYYTCTTL